MQRPEAVLFDNDGTLVDTYDLILASFRHCTREVLGVELSENELMSNQSQPLDVQMTHLSDDPETRRLLLDSYRAHNHAHHDAAISAFPGVREGLARLADAGISLGVVTSKTHWLAQRGCKILGLDGFFSALVGREDTARHKPDPEPVAYGATLLGIDPRRCVYAGDSPFDVQAGRAAHAATIAVSWGSFSRERLEAEHPDAICDTFDELADIVLAGFPRHGEEERE